MLNFYSESYAEATDKFMFAAAAHGKVSEYKSERTEYAIPVLAIGHGPRKIVINSGIHGIEGFFGSAAYNFWLSTNAKFLDKKFHNDFSIYFIHGINGFGMDRRLRETANNVDLNRNFRNSWETPPPVNELYKQGHDLIVSAPHVRAGEVTKFQKILDFYNLHRDDGVYKSLTRGQYEYPDGIFYGGTGPEPETEMVTKIYDDIMANGRTKFLLSVGLHTGIGKYRPNRNLLTRKILVSHPGRHPNTLKFAEIFAPDITIVPDDRAEINADALSGDLVDYLEVRYAKLKKPIWTADFEIGTGTFSCSDQTKRMDQGDARWEIANLGRITKTTWNHLTESWYPSDPKWREMALGAADIFAQKLYEYMLKII
ncbi:MAG: DUF2817 domain-containing protein [Proteobacteria bacterium]|nr:DUF2817 domain-containing protein [Pseudomonadota bacterium]